MHQHSAGWRALIREPLLAVALTLASLGGNVPLPQVATSDETGVQTPASSFQLVEATAESGLDFLHDHGGSGERYMVETMGAGLALVDLDVDGWLDVYFVQSAATPGYSETVDLHNILYRGLGEGTFVEVSAAGGADDPSYGQGVSAADYDNDGFIDLYVTNFGANVLYRNNGDGTFADTTSSAGVGDGLWGTSTAWGDIDNDSHLDLYVVNYVDFGWDNHKFCGRRRLQLRAYCPPQVYNGQADVLYRNLGDGTFVDISASAGIDNALEGKGLGVVFGDYDDDGDIDLYVANDSIRNFLYTNQGDGTYIDDGLLAGVGYNKDGQAEGGMGTDWGDFDGDGLLDVVVTNLDLETNTLYRNRGMGAFTDITFGVGMGETSFLSVGFGTNWMDIDNDADLDLFVANGHVVDNVKLFKDNVEYEQPNHLYRNDGDENFTEIGAQLGSGMQLIKVARGSAIGDIDNDGDLDIVVANNDQAADYLRNEGANQTGHWLQLRLIGRHSNRSAAGARIIVEPDIDGGRRMVAEVKTGSSYCSTSDPRLHVGLGAAGAARVSVRWPGDTTESLGRLEPERLYVIHEGRGVIAVRAAGRR